MQDLDEEELKATREIKAINKIVAGVEKTADEMFKDLGYEKIIENNIRIDYERKGQFLDKEIEFGLIDKIIVAESGIGECTNINMQELQAINKKVEELRMENLGIILFLIGILGFLIMIIVEAFKISVTCGLFVFFIILAFVGSIMGEFFTEAENVEDDWEEY